jgi:hypothetical protein
MPSKWYISTKLQGVTSEKSIIIVIRRTVYTYESTKFEGTVTYCSSS